jgi:hypothetical protein
MNAFEIKQIITKVLSEHGINGDTYVKNQGENLLIGWDAPDGRRCGVTAPPCQTADEFRRNFSESVITSMALVPPKEAPAGTTFVRDGQRYFKSRTGEEYPVLECEPDDLIYQYTPEEAIRLAEGGKPGEGDSIARRIKEGVAQDLKKLKQELDDLAHKRAEVIAEFKKRNAAVLDMPEIAAFLKGVEPPKSGE